MSGQCLDKVLKKYGNLFSKLHRNPVEVLNGMLSFVDAKFKIFPSLQNL